MGEAIDGSRRHCEEVRVLGSYAAATTVGGVAIE